MEKDEVNGEVGRATRHHRTVESKSQVSIMGQGPLGQVEAFRAGGCRSVHVLPG